jgi:hypothetical protein
MHVSANQPQAKATTFTGRKLDWLKCIRFDRRIKHLDYRVAAVIADHLNERSGRAFISDHTIAFEIGSNWPRHVIGARNRLRDAGWLEWEHSKTANIYAPVFRAVTETLRIIGRARAEKRESYEKRKKSLNYHARLGHQSHTEPDSDQIAYPDSDS